jgi:hypothetical protein
MARELEFVDALHLGGVAGGVDHEVGNEGPGPAIREDDAMDVRVSLVTGLDGEVAAKVLREMGLDAGEGCCVLQTSRLR